MLDDATALGADWRRGGPLPEERPRALPELIDAACRAHDRRPVLHDRGDRWSWRGLIARADALRAHLGTSLAPGAHLAILGANSAPHLIAELACWRAGAIAVPYNPLAPPPRLARLESDLRPVAWIADEPDRLGGIAAKALASTSVADLPEAAAPPVFAAAEDAPALLLHTSGSTGAPRGVLLSHGNLASQQAAFARLWPEVGPDDLAVGYLPWHHSFGALAERLWALLRGCRLHTVPGDGRDRQALFSELRRRRPSVFMSVPKLHDAIAAAGVLDPGRLRWVFTAGAPLAPVTERRYAAAGICVLEGWGTTECSPSLTITPPDEPRVPGVVGRPIPGVAVGVAADGRLLADGPGVMLGYWDGRVLDPARRADGSFDTGDCGEWCDGGLRLAGRRDHVLKHPNGEKVPVRSLEAALEARPGIRHAVVHLDGDDLIAICCADEVAAVRAAVAAYHASQDVGWLRIARAYRTPEPFDAAGSLTPSFKIDRARIIERFREGGGVEVEG